MCVVGNIARLIYSKCVSNSTWRRVTAWSVDVACCACVSCHLLRYAASAVWASHMVHTHTNTSVWDKLPCWIFSDGFLPFTHRQIHAFLLFLSYSGKCDGILHLELLGSWAQKPTANTHAYTNTQSALEQVQRLAMERIKSRDTQGQRDR